MAHGNPFRRCLPPGVQNGKPATASGRIVRRGRHRNLSTLFVAVPERLIRNCLLTVPTDTKSISMNFSSEVLLAAQWRTVRATIMSWALLSLLAGCGSGGSGEDSGSPPTIASGGVAAAVTVINGVSVPPDPGSTSKTSLAGVDGNANGIRDDVERELALFYGKSPAMHSAVIAFARKLQLPLARPAANTAEATTAITNALTAFECLAAAMGNRDQAIATAEIVAARTYNTRARVTEQARVHDLSGIVELLEIERPTCD